MADVKLPAFKILKAVPQHAESLGSSGLAMMLAICAQWDALGCSTAVCWSNSRLAERSGLSRNSVDKVRTRLIESGWLCYLQDGRKAGHYTPKLPEWYAQSSAVECANGAQLSVQTLCKYCAVECAYTVQMRVTYIPIPNPSPIPNPEPERACQRGASGEGENLFSDSLSEPPMPISDEDRWHADIKLQDWPRALKRAMCCIGARNWIQWQGLVDDHGLERVIAAAQRVPSDRRWPSDVSAVLSDGTTHLDDKETPF